VIEHNLSGFVEGRLQCPILGLNWRGRRQNCGVWNPHNSPRIARVEPPVFAETTRASGANSKIIAPLHRHAWSLTTFTILPCFRLWDNVGPRCTDWLMSSLCLQRRLFYFFGQARLRRFPWKRLAISYRRRALWGVVGRPGWLRSFLQPKIFALRCRSAVLGRRKCQAMAECSLATKFNPASHANRPVARSQPHLGARAPGQADPCHYVRGRPRGRGRHPRAWQLEVGPGIGVTPAPGADRDGPYSWPICPRNGLRKRPRPGGPGRHVEEIAGPRGHACVVRWQDFMGRS